MRESWPGEGGSCAVPRRAMCRRGKGANTDSFKKKERLRRRRVGKKETMQEIKGQGPGLVNVLWARASKHVFVVNATLAHPHNSDIPRDFRLCSQWHTHASVYTRGHKAAICTRSSVQNGPKKHAFFLKPVLTNSFSASAASRARGACGVVAREATCRQ